MPVVVPFDARRFRTAAPYYRSGRPAYAPLLIKRVAAAAGLGDDDRVLDLGCGPGQLGVAFAPFAGEVVAMDPEPEMLSRAGATAEEAGVRLTLIEGSSYDLGPELGRFRLVVIGRAFHWMDRTVTLEALDRLIEPDGAVVLFHAEAPSIPENAWRGDFDAVVGRFSGSDSRPRRGAPDWTSHETVLLDSPFSALERLGVVERRATPVERFVDRALSLSATSAQRLGDATGLFTDAIRAAVAPHARDDIVREVVESSALIARREPG